MGVSGSGAMDLKLVTLTGEKANLTIGRGMVRRNTTLKWSTTTFGMMHLIGINDVPFVNTEQIMI